MDEDLMEHLRKLNVRINGAEVSLRKGDIGAGMKKFLAEEVEFAKECRGFGHELLGRRARLRERALKKSE